MKKLQRSLLTLFQPHFSGVKPDDPDAASSSGSSEAASCQKQGRSSLWGLSFPVRDKIEVKAVIQCTLACNFEVLCDVLPVVGLRPQVPNSPLPLTHDPLTSPSRNQPSVVLMPDYSPTEANLSGDKSLLSGCLEPALVPLLCRDFMSSCPMVFGGGSGWVRGRKEKKT